MCPKLQTIRRFDNIGSYVKGGASFNVSYMCYETGIGSGTIHYEGSLYPTLEEAQAECENRNKANLTIKALET